MLLSIGPTETMHFQTWRDKAGNAPPLTDPTNGLTFPDLNSSPFGGETFQTNLIMPEPSALSQPQVPGVSIIRPTETKGAAVGTLKFLTDDGLFRGQSPAFFELMTTWPGRRTPHGRIGHGDRGTERIASAGCSARSPTPTRRAILIRLIDGERGRQLASPRRSVQARVPAHQGAGGRGLSSAAPAFARLA